MKSDLADRRPWFSQSTARSSAPAVASDDVPAEAATHTPAAGFTETQQSLTASSAQQIDALWKEINTWGEEGKEASGTVANEIAGVQQAWVDKEKQAETAWITNMLRPSAWKRMLLAAYKSVAEGVSQFPKDDETIIRKASLSRWSAKDRALKQKIEQMSNLKIHLQRLLVIGMNEADSINRKPMVQEKPINVFSALDDCARSHNTSDLWWVSSTNEVSKLISEVFDELHKRSINNEPFAEVHVGSYAIEFHDAKQLRFLKNYFGEGLSGFCDLDIMQRSLIEVEYLLSTLNAWSLRIGIHDPDVLQRMVDDIKKRMDVFLALRMKLPVCASNFELRVPDLCCVPQDWRPATAANEGTCNNSTEQRLMQITHKILKDTNFSQHISDLKNRLELMIEDGAGREAKFNTNSLNQLASAPYLTLFDHEYDNGTLSGDQHGGSIWHRLQRCASSDSNSLRSSLLRMKSWLAHYNTGASDSMHVRSAHLMNAGFADFLSSWTYVTDSTPLSTTFDQTREKISSKLPLSECQ
eukprot:gnl/TRDRNA2_/TRDRNA2_134479_c1_seq2.p1 gnl/TRDRNA2_/TRDRNA2_134479_c1~~gnl/TRDRNA2_/TRDRNA2_134479_c1_seq2.p1  ORF type:complete len:565 (+),score=79.38 gnl/TRDRNA2_/TRDRNA2_134479_c1_seq2:119-1696(+)